MSVDFVNVSPDIRYENPLYCDANLFCYARNRLSPKYQIARTILADLLIQRVSLLISNLVVDEMWWALLRIWHRNITGIQLTSTIIKNNPSLLGRYVDLIKKNTDKLLRIPGLTVLPTQQPTTSITREALEIYKSENLMPRDCFHLAYTKIANAMGFITSDQDFDNLSLPNYNLVIYKY